MMMSSRPLPAFTSPLGGCGETGFPGRRALSLTLQPRGQHFYGDEATVPVTCLGGPEKLD